MNPNPDLLPSLGKLVRGLTSLFWGLPLALIACVQTVAQNIRFDWMRPLGIAPALVGTVWLFWALWQMQSFQKQERIWRQALDYAKLLALVNVGLSPFLFFWSRLPGEPFFAAATALLGISALLFLMQLNIVLRRLSAMLPDETLRTETKQFTALNQTLLAWTLLLGILYFVLTQAPALPLSIAVILDLLMRHSLWLSILFVLLPLALTMALIWKTKEVIFESVFGGE